MIDPDVALALAEGEAEIPAEHHLLAPTLPRSQVSARLFVEVQRGELSRKEAERRLDYVRALGIRLLGDRVRREWPGKSPMNWVGKTPSLPSTSP